MLTLCLVVLCSYLCISYAAYDDTFELSLAERFVALSGAAYCTNPIFTVDTVEDWSCQACSLVSYINATSVHGILTDANGFVGFDTAANEIVVSFSGTDPLSIRNWIDDLDFLQAEYPLCDNCEVHQGFYNTYLSVSDDVIALVDAVLIDHPTAIVRITGHSLGAALAAHCAAHLTSFNKYTLGTLYTYGMPRVGNKAFESWYTSVVPGTFRMVHYKDPVPQVPPQAFGYHHMPYEVFYTFHYENWKVCSYDGEDSACSDQYFANLDVVNHLNYLDFDFTSNWFSCEL